MLAVKRGIGRYATGTIINLSDDYKVLIGKGYYHLVEDTVNGTKLVFEILNPKRAKQQIDEYLSRLPQPPEPITVSPAKEDPIVLENDPVAVPPAASMPVENINEAQPEEWHPQASEWYAATLKLHDKVKHYCLLKLSNDETAFANVNAFSSSPGAHVCGTYVPKGTPVMVRLEETPTGLRCLEVIVEGQWQHDGADEEAVIMHWNERNVGNGERDCGCNIQVIGERDVLPFSPGDRIRGQFKWNTRRANWSLQNPEKV